MPDGRHVLDAILNERLGLDQASIGSGLVPRATRARMRATGLVEPAAYAELVARSEAELQALIDEVVVPESWFFRDVLPFAFLHGLAREGWTARPAREPLRVLSLPCAGGEEPFSIAVTLDEAGLGPGRSCIDAVDVSARRLEHARLGLYSLNALRGVGPDRVARWFRIRGENFEILQPVRDRVQFHLGNVLDAALLADVPKYDVIFCRNLLIYLARDARARAEANLERLLAPDGVVVIGHADTLGASAAGRAFVLAAARGAFAYRRRKPGEIPPPPLELALPAPPPSRPAAWPRQRSRASPAGRRPAPSRRRPAPRPSRLRIRGPCSNRRWSTRTRGGTAKRWPAASARPVARGLRRRSTP
ncbi:CheR family methyltransferase [Paludisphaera mucosa]|uniref:Protein-glutamate O-methyltransferase CheR n=1 Tax=Paludisphaera mucosa TaxID=3030827 RepID=A0ABT6FBB2_9BACT|nr:protein-glutamate O-methyltransferase CheR [Paludisphaera mucosa]MDG3004882.1 protein-glutamate O-methyltransferase CheR [Paludisphaera mucosa]